MLAFVVNRLQEAHPGRWRTPAGIGVRAGKVTSKPEVGKHFLPDIGERPFAWSLDQASIDAEAAFDGIYAIRIPVLSAPGTRRRLAACRTSPTSGPARDQPRRPGPAPRLRQRSRVRGRVLICMLACHLRRAWVPTPTPETRQPLDSPVAPFSAQPGMMPMRPAPPGPSG